MTKSLARGAAALAACFAASAVFGADAPQRMMCATLEALDCEAGAPCFKGRPADMGAPPFMRVDIEKMTVSGPKRTTPIVTIEKSAEGLLLQGTETGYGWTLAIDTRDLSMAATLVNREGAFVLFGSCTAM